MHLKPKKTFLAYALMTFFPVKKNLKKEEEFLLKISSDIIFVMKKRSLNSHLILISLLISTTTTFCLNAEITVPVVAAVSEADGWFDAGLFERAIPIYKETLSKQSDPKIRCCLAKAYFLIHDYSNVIALLESFSYPSLTSEEHYLLGVSFRKQSNYARAIQEQMACLQNQIDYCEQVRFELGLSYFLSGNFNAAKELFQELSQGPQLSTKLQQVAGLYLIKIGLIEEQLNPFTDSNLLIERLRKQISPYSGLLFELDYLLGEMAFAEGKFATAIEHYEKALPIQKKHSAPWHAETMHRLGESYLHLAETKQHELEKQAVFKRLESILEQSLAFQYDQSILLLLARVYFLHAKHLKDENAYLKGQALLENGSSKLSLENKTASILLRAQYASSYEERTKLYSIAIKEGYLDKVLLIKALYLQGINHFEQGCLLRQQKQTEAANEQFLQAETLFQKSYEWSRNLEENQELSNLIGPLKGWSHTSISYGNLDNCKKVFLEIEGLFKAYEARINPQEKNELLLLCGQLAVFIAQAEYRTKALTLLTSEPSLESTPLCYIFALLQYQNEDYVIAEKLFWNFANRYPKHEWACESAFWAARCADHTKNSGVGQTYRRYVFEQYPDSRMAAEAFFTFYSINEYLHGDRTCLKHLQKMVTKYPNSPFTIYAWYLIGLEQKKGKRTMEGKWIGKKNLVTAIDAFQSAESTFDRLLPDLQHDANYDSLLILRYKSFFEKAMANLSISQESEGIKKEIYLEYALDLFKTVTEECEQPSSILATCSKEKDIEQVKNEISMGYAEALKIANRYVEADQILTDLQLKYDRMKTTRGYILSKIWYNRALIQMKLSEFNAALEMLTHAENAGQGPILHPEEKLEIWIQKSCCYESLGEYEQAILLLSKAINEELVSPIRLKAIYLRANTYQKFGKDELARRQFEALAKLNGEWSQKAQERLSQDYGY